MADSKYDQKETEQNTVAFPPENGEGDDKGLIEKLNEKYDKLVADIAPLLQQKKV